MSRIVVTTPGDFAADAVNPAGNRVRGRDSGADRGLRLGHAGQRRLDFAVGGVDQAADLDGGLGRALGELAHFVGDDGKTAPLLAGAGGLDGGVEREQVGLVGDLADHADDVVHRVRAAAEGVERGVEAADRERNFPDVAGQVADGGGRIARDCVGLPRQLFAAGSVVGDLADADGQLLDARGAAAGGVELLGRSLRDLPGHRLERRQLAVEAGGMGTGSGEEVVQAGDETVEGGGGLADFVVVVRGQPAGQVGFAGGDFGQRVAQLGQAAEQPAQRVGGQGDAEAGAGEAGQPLLE